MANVAGPYGFQQVGTASGPPNFARAGGPSPYLIYPGYATALFFGDAVRMAVSADNLGGSNITGYVVQWANGDGGTSATRILSGIFTGCEYYSVSQRKTIFNNYWPGSDAPSGSTIYAYVCDDPSSQWMAQAGGTAINYTNIGQGVDIAATPAGNTTTGISGMLLSTPSATASVLPFKVVNLVTTPPGVNGTDDTTGYNNVIVAFNYQQYKTQAGAN